MAKPPKYLRTLTSDRRKTLPSEGRPHQSAGDDLEATAQAWVLVSSLDDWIARQSSLVTKRTVLPVVVQRIQIAEGLARNLERLVLERRARQALSLAD